jgi:hypothetical protein
MPTKKGNTSDYFFLSFFLFSGPRFEIRDPGWEKIRIRD